MSKDQNIFANYRFDFQIYFDFMILGAKDRLALHFN